MTNYLVLNGQTTEWCTLETIKNSLVIHQSTIEILKKHALSYCGSPNIQNYKNAIIKDFDEDYWKCMIKRYMGLEYIKLDKLVHDGKVWYKIK